MTTAVDSLRIGVEAMCCQLESHHESIKDGEFEQSKFALLLIMRQCTKSYAICERLEKENAT